MLPSIPLALSNILGKRSWKISSKKTTPLIKKINQMFFYDLWFCLHLSHWCSVSSPPLLLSSISTCYSTCTCTTWSTTKYIQLWAEHHDKKDKVFRDMWQISLKTIAFNPKLRFASIFLLFQISAVWVISRAGRKCSRYMVSSACLSFVVHVEAVWNCVSTRLRAHTKIHMLTEVLIQALINYL